MIRKLNEVIYPKYSISDQETKFTAMENNAKNDGLII